MKCKKNIFNFFRDDKSKKSLLNNSKPPTLTSKDSKKFTGIYNEVFEKKDSKPNLVKNILIPRNMPSKDVNSQLLFDFKLEKAKINSQSIDKKIESRNTIISYNNDTKPKAKLGNFL